MTNEYLIRKVIEEQPNCNCDSCRIDRNWTRKAQLRLLDAFIEEREAHYTLLQDDCEEHDKGLRIYLREEIAEKKRLRSSLTEKEVTSNPTTDGE